MGVLGWIRSYLAGPLDHRASMVDALVSDGEVALANGDLYSAQASLSSALSISSMDGGVQGLRARLLFAQGNAQGARDAFLVAAGYPRLTDAQLLEIARGLHRCGDLESAATVYQQTIQSFPGNVAALSAFGCFLMMSGRPMEARDVLERSLSLDPGHRDSLAWLGQVLSRLMQYDAAADRLIEADAIFPLDTVGTYILGWALLNARRDDEAEKVLVQGLDRAPEDSLLSLALSIVRLMRGEWASGWALHERRYDALRDYPEVFDGGPVMNNVVRLGLGDPRLGGIKPWHGEPIRGTRILLWAEQGLGDTIMSLRFVPVFLEELGASSLTLIIPSALLSLARSSFPGVDCRALEGDWEVLPGDVDYHCSLMSVAGFLHAEPERIPGVVPYLAVSSELRKTWAARVSSLPGLRVGVVWSGNAVLQTDALRSVPFELFAPLLSIDGISFVCLQKDATLRQRAKRSCPNLIDWMDECTDFVDTAALIAALDMVITVDTAVAHLAGALGCPTWLLNRHEGEWRWLRNRTSSVWYPSMRIFDQPRSRQWQELIENLSRELVAAKESADVRGR